jgi:hypothetical protein
MTSPADTPGPADETPEICTTLVGQAVTGGKAALVNQFKWQLGQTIRVQFLEGHPILRERVANIARLWTGPGMANLRLAFVDSGPSDVRVTFQLGQGSRSAVGTDALHYPNQPTMNFGWLAPDSEEIKLRSVVLHEFGHMMGLIHEHQTPLNPVKWNRSAVIKDLSGPPNNWDEATIQLNIFDSYDPAKVTGTARDPKSIMMYPIPAAWTLDGFTSTLNPDLSPLDRQLIGQVYPH